jgi:hypothetical protein
VWQSKQCLSFTLGLWGLNAGCSSLFLKSIKNPIFFRCKISRCLFFYFLVKEFIDGYRKIMTESYGAMRNAYCDMTLDLMVCKICTEYGCCSNEQDQCIFSSHSAMPLEI